MPVPLPDHVPDAVVPVCPVEEPYCSLPYTDEADEPPWPLEASW